MGLIFQQPMRRVRHDLMGHFNFLALAHWWKIMQIDINYYFQSFFNEHEYKYAVDVMRNKGNNKITELRTILQRESKNS